MADATLLVILPRAVRGDWPISHHTVAVSGAHEARVNPHGAVSVIATNGRLLGIKPDEFRWAGVRLPVLSEAQDA